jgi:hypothetical protein
MNSNLDELITEVKASVVQMGGVMHIKEVTLSDRIATIQLHLSRLVGADFEKQQECFLLIAAVALESAQSVARRNDAAEQCP